LGKLVEPRQAEVELSAGASNNKREQQQQTFATMTARAVASSAATAASQSRKKAMFTGPGANKLQSGWLLAAEEEHATTHPAAHIFELLERTALLGLDAAHPWLVVQLCVHEACENTKAHPNRDDLKIHHQQIAVGGICSSSDHAAVKFSSSQTHPASC
jgi:hypothetical protein